MDKDGEVLGYDDYYPFGLQMPGRSSNTANPNHLYKYSSKELDEEIGLDWYYFGARYYDPVIGRWMAVDPMAGKYPGWSPYNYTLNSPITNFDPDGREVTITINRTSDNRTTTMGTISVTSDQVNNSFSGYTLEPSSSDAARPKINASSYSAFQREISSDGSAYSPNRIQMNNVTNEDGNAMFGAQIHIGNELEDTQGCVLVGETAGTNSVGSSRAAMVAINAVIDADGSGVINVIINNPRPLPPQPDGPPRNGDGMVEIY